MGVIDIAPMRKCHLQAGLLIVILCTFSEARRAEAAAPEDHGETPLCDAALRGDLARVRALLDQGADVNGTYGGGVTALMKAAGLPLMASIRAQYPGSPEVMRLLVARGADVNAQTRSGRTALMEAVASSSSESVRILLEAGANVNGADRHGETALMRAASLGLDDVVEELLRRGAQVNAGRDWNGNTALTSAIRQAPRLREVLDENCPPGFTCQGRPSSKFETFERHFRVVEALLAHGADLGTVDRNGARPLTIAATGGHALFVRLLLDHGADVNAADGAMGDSTALILAVRNGNAAMIKAVLEKHPGVTQKDRFGKSALDYAIEAHEQWAIDMLRQAGAR